MLLLVSYSSMSIFFYQLCQCRICFLLFLQSSCTGFVQDGLKFLHRSWEDTAGIADSSWPKGYPKQYHIMLSNKTGRWGLPCWGTGWALVVWLGATVFFCITCFYFWLFVCFVFFPTFFLLPFLLIITLFIASHEFSHCYPSDTSPYPTGEGRTEWLCGA